MRYSLLLLAGVALFTAVDVSRAPAQSHEIPQLNSCIKEFYDPEMYNYLTFKNNCAQALTLVYVAKDGSGAGGTMDLRPGAKDSVGRLSTGVPKVGAFAFYVCEAGSVPLDENNKVVSKPGATFKCQARAQ